MKRLLLSLSIVMLGIVGLLGQTTLPTEKITFTSTKTTAIRVDVKPIKGVVPKIDWGDGTPQSGTKNWQGLYAFNGIPQGTVTIYGSCIEADLSNFSAGNEITTVNFVSQDSLAIINLVDNKITTLDLMSLPNLQTLDVSNNEMTSLNLNNLANIEYLTARNNQLTNIILGDNQKLKELSVSQNDISTLVIPQVLSALKVIDVEENALTSIDLSKSPNLTKLTITKNGFSNIDLTPSSKLEKLYANENYFSTIDLSKSTEMLNLSLNKNLLQNIDLSKNNKLTSVEVAENQLKNIDLSNISKLQTLNVSKNIDILHIDIRKNNFLKTLNADSTSIAGLDANENTHLEKVYLRYTRFSPVAFTQFFKTMPEQWFLGYQPNIYLANTSYVGADFSILEAKKLRTDLAEGVQTGTVVTPQQCTINLEVGQGGTATLSTYKGTITSLPTTIEEGMVVYIDVAPDTAHNYELNDIKGEIVNEQGDTVQIPIIAPAMVVEVDTKIIVSFRKKDTREIKLVSSLQHGSAINLTLRQEENSIKDQISIDWGNGQKIEYNVTKVQDTQNVIEGVLSGDTIRIYGAVNKIGASEIGLTSVDFSKTESIIEFDFYGNELTTIDLSTLKNLEIFNLSMNNLTGIDLSQNTKLRSAKFYGNSEIGSLDLSNNKELVELFAKNTGLTTLSLDLPKLEELDLHDNQLTSIDLTKVPKLVVLRLGWNKFVSFGNGVQLDSLKLLSIYHNELKELELSGFPLLEWLYVQQNPLENFTIPKTLTLINKIEVSDCGLDACSLNTLYSSLPQWKPSAYGNDTEPVNLYNRGQGSNANDAEGSYTNIATSKGWSVAAFGDGSGCNDTATDNLEIGNGINIYTQNDICFVTLNEEYADASVTIHSISGQKVFEGNNRLKYTIKLNRGTYILMVKGKAFKFIV